MKKQLGELIRSARAKAELTRAQAAKALGISEGYLGHLENSVPVHLSDALADKLVKTLRVPMSPLNTIRKLHSKRSAKWYRDHAKKPAKKVRRKAAA